MLTKIQPGAEVAVTIRRPRNLAHHRKFFALVDIVWQNQERYSTKEHLLAALKVALGHADEVRLRDGGVAYLPKSISFAAMDQNAFDEFYDRTLDLVAKHILPGIDEGALRDEVEEFLR